MLSADRPIIREGYPGGLSGLLSGRAIRAIIRKSGGIRTALLTIARSFPPPPPQPRQQPSPQPTAPQAPSIGRAAAETLRHLGLGGLLEPESMILPSNFGAAERR